MNKTTSEGVGKFYQGLPALAVIVTAQANGRENAMAVAWHAPVSFNPPLYGVSISPKRFTYQLIAESNEFGVNFLPFEAAELVASVGGSKGSETDKFQKFGIARNKPVRTAVPILEAAYAAYECRLVDDKGYGDHRWLVGEIVATHLMKEVFTPDEIVDLNKVSPILYLGNEIYATISKDTLKSLDRKVYGRI